MMADVNVTLLPHNDSLLNNTNNSIVVNINDQEKLNSIKSNNRSIKVTWKDINVDLPCSNNRLQLFNNCNKQTDTSIKPKRIIDNIDGIAKSNEVLAIMGASGAGKTTLLNVLTYRNRGNLKISGEIKVNGHLIKSVDEISSISGYVQQDDLFLGYLTVKEHLIFQAIMRMDRKFSKEERLQRVEEVMIDLNLKKCEDAYIAIAGKKGISGGEKRRLAFASEVLTDPCILFCDEPTSGLDSFMAMSVVDCLKNLARKGKTIICTIHQPSSEIFEMFDKLCLLAEGRLAFIGTLNQSYQFFSNQGYQVPFNYNPSDFYIKTLAISPNEKETSLKRINEICNAFQKNVLKEELNNEISTIDQQNNLSEPDYTINFKEELGYKASFITQMVWLVWRNWMAEIRNPMAFRIQIMQSIIISILFGFIFFQLKLNQQAAINMNGVIFLCLINNSFSSLFAVVNTFPAEMPILIREHQNRMYRVLSFYLSKIIMDLPVFTIVPFLFTSIFYWMANLNNDMHRFFICVGIIILVAQTAVAFGTFLSACSPNTNVAMALSGPIMVPLLVFSGFIINFNDIPKIFLGLRYLSWFSYANEALQINQWLGVENLKCDSYDCVQAFSSGDLILSFLQMEPDNFYTDIYCLFILIVGWRILAYIILIIKTMKR